MEKTITIPVIASDVSIRQEEQSYGFVTREISLPDEKPYSASGIWKDESVFACGDEREDYQLRMSTDVLLALIEQTKQLTESPNTHWWSNSILLHKKFLDLFGTDEILSLKAQIAELESQISKKKKK